jgi:hypothetical protein
VTTIVAPAGLVNLQAPVPSPRQFTLLDAADLIVPTSNRWLAGAWIEDYPNGPAHTQDPCSQGTDRIKSQNEPMGDNITGRFTVYMDAFCTASGIGSNQAWLTDRLKLAFQVYETAAVERVLATGDGHSTLGPYLGDVNMETLGGGVVSGHRALQLLEDAIALNGTGIIHATPAIYAEWASEYLVTPVRVGSRQAQTVLGTPVAVGAGYIGAYPFGESAPAADQAWAFASGPIQVYRDPEIQIIGDYAQSLDRSNNDLRFIAERPYLFNWIGRQSSADDNHTQAGVLIDLVP